MAIQTDAYPELDRVKAFFPLGVAEPSILSVEQIQQFNEKGYIFPLDVFSSAEMVAHRAYFDDLLEKAFAAGWDSYGINGWHKHCAGMYDLVTEPRILDYVQDLLGEDLVLWGTHYFVKMPGDSKRVSWHQDASYWPLTPSKTVTVWLAMDDADAENGAMQFIPSSHRNAQISYTESRPEENNVLGQTVLDAEYYGESPVTVALKAGQMSLHTDWLLHGSEPNMSVRRRCGLTLRFVSSDVRAYNNWNQGSSVICRGSDPSGHWANYPRPVGELIPQKEDALQSE
ncbi:MAG: phytanoyl-CoA dioxygenase family protein [Chloroflexota bacterium]